MSKAVMSEQPIDASPRLKARVTGGFWLACIVTSIFGTAPVFRLIALNDATTTATNILANESLFRLCSVAEFISGASYVGVTVLLYSLLKPVSRSLSLLAAFFGLAGVVIGCAYFLSNLTALGLLHGDQYLGAFTAAQLQAMALVALKLRAHVFNSGMVFFGIQCFLAGCLIVRSTFLPRILGVLLAAGGCGYVISSMVSFLAPLFGARLMPFLLTIVFVGEGSLTLWLLVKGVNAQRWAEQADAARGWRPQAPTHA